MQFREKMVMYLFCVIFKSLHLCSSFIYVALRVYLTDTLKIFRICNSYKFFRSKRYLKESDVRFYESIVHLGFYAGTNSIYTPVTSVIVVKMNFPKSNTRLSLPCPIKKNNDEL